MARMTQVNIDASGLQGVDLSQVLNQKVAWQKTPRTRLNPLNAGAAKASISAAAQVSTAGEWAAIPQDLGSGALKASMVLPSSTPGGAPRKVAPTTAGVAIGITSVAIFGVTMGGGLYQQLGPREYGLVGSMGFALSTSLGLTVAADVFFVDGPVSLLDGKGMVITVNLSAPGKLLFAGFGILVSLPSWSIIGYLFEAGGGLSAAPPVSLTVTLNLVSGHVRF